MFVRAYHARRNRWQLVSGPSSPNTRLFFRPTRRPALAAGDDLKDIQETLAHSSIAINANTNTSVIDELEAERTTAEAAATLVPRTRRRAS